MFYVSALRTGRVDVFDMSAKTIHITVTCESVMDAMYVFYKITSTTKFKDVVMSSSKPVVDVNMYNPDVMNSDEFLLSVI